MMEAHPVVETPSSGPPATLDGAYRRITMRLLPFLMVLWILSWIDRVNIGFAKLQMLADLKFSETVYGIGAGIFFIGYFICEVPSNLLLERIGARKTIARITFLWGICCVAMMFVTTPAFFFVLRFFLGVFEAGFYPGVILFLTYWYPTERRAKVFGLFMSASALAGVIGGPLAGGILTGMNGVNGWAGWQWVFLLEGIPSILAGVVTLLYLTDRPSKAGWLTPEQRALVEADLARDAAALGQREHRILASLKDVRVWQCIAIFFCIVTANSALTFFGPSVVREAGFTDPLTVGWIMSAAYLCGGAGMILNGRHSDRTGEARLHCGVPASIGALAIAAVGFLIPSSPVLAMALILGRPIETEMMKMLRTPWLRQAALAPVVLAAGCVAPGSFGHAPTEADFATIQPGMSSQEVLARFGRPTWIFGVRQENMSIWNYRYNRNDCVIYQIGVRPDGTVRDAGTGYDPACDGPSHL